MADPTICVARCHERSMRKRQPGDYFVVIVNTLATSGNLAGLFPVLEGCAAPCWAECDLGYYRESVPVPVELLPRELLEAAMRVEPVGPIVWRKRISHDELQAMWATP